MLHFHVWAMGLGPLQCLGLVRACPLRYASVVPSHRMTSFYFANSSGSSLATVWVTLLPHLTWRPVCVCGCVFVCVAVCPSWQDCGISAGQGCSDTSIETQSGVIRVAPVVDPEIPHDHVLATSPATTRAELLQWAALFRLMNLSYSCGMWNASTGLERARWSTMAEFALSTGRGVV